MNFLGFFSDQVIQTVHEFRLLDECDDPVSTLGEVGVDYLARRLINNTLPISPAWASIRRVAAQLASPDEEPETFATYVRLLCARAADSHGHFSMAAACLRPATYFDAVYDDAKYDCVLLAAAAYLNKLSVIDELTNGGEHARCSGIVLGSPDQNAILRGNSEALQLLDSKLNKTRVSALAPVLSLHCSPDMFERFRPKWTTQQLETSDKRHYRYFERALRTPSVENFNTLMRLKKTTKQPQLTKMQLAAYLHRASRSGWEDMTRHLLGLGAPVEGDPRLYDDFGSPLTGACVHGHSNIAQILLEQGAKIEGTEIGDAAKKGRWDMVSMLADRGADINLGDEPPIVSAVAFEREDIFYELLKRGATLKGPFGAKALQTGTANGLESMLLLLEKHGVNPAEVATRVNN